MVYRGDNGNGDRGEPPRGTGQFHPVGVRDPSRGKQRLDPAPRRMSNAKGGRSAPPQSGTPVDSLGIQEFLFSFNGRVSRSQFVVGILGIMIFYSFGVFALWPICKLLPGFIKLIAILVYLAAMIWSFFAVQAKRFHDFGFSGYWALTSLIPVINFISALCLAFKKGEMLQNQFGYPANPAPLPLSIICYPPYMLILLINLLPAAVKVPGIDKIPGVRYLTVSPNIEEVKSVDQLIDAMPGIVQDTLINEEVKPSLGIILLEGKMIAAGVFITEKRILLNNDTFAPAVQDALKRQQKLQVKNLDKEAYVTQMVASAPTKQMYVFEVDAPIGIPLPMKDKDLADLNAIDAFK